MDHYWVKGVFATILFGSLFLGFDLSMATAQRDTEIAQKQTLFIGTGTIEDGNMPEAREMAISEALIKGVEAYLTRRLGSQGMIYNFPRLLQEVIPKAKEGIENFHILAEERVDTHYKILVSVKVNDNVMEEILREIGIVLIERPPIKVLFLVSQVEFSDGELLYWWKEPETDSALTPVELALHRVFQERGFHPINRLSKIPEGEYSSEMKGLDLSDKDAVGWGRLFSVDVVIRGRCEIIKGREVTVMLKALRVENGLMIYQDMQSESLKQGPVEGMEQVIETIEIAVHHVVGRLSPEIMMAVQLPEAEINRVELTLRGLRSFRQFRAFKDFLEKDIPGVRSIKQTRVRGHEVSVAVEFLGDEESFLDKISVPKSLPFEADLTRTEEGEIIVVIKEFP